MFAETPAWPASALDRWPGVFPNGVFIHLHLCEQQSCWTRVKNPMFSAEAAHRSVFLLIHHPGVAFTSSAKTHGIPSTLSATEAANGAAVARSCSPPAQPEPDGASPHEARSAYSATLESSLEFFQEHTSLRSASGGSGRAEMLTEKLHASLL